MPMGLAPQPIKNVVVMGVVTVNVVMFMPVVMMGMVAVAELLLMNEPEHREEADAHQRETDSHQEQPRDYSEHWIESLWQYVFGRDQGHET
jgi:hypothetical protein